MKESNLKKDDIDSVMKYISLQITQIRVSKGLTEEDLAGKAGVTWKDVFDLELGKDIDIITLIKILSVLDIELELFFKKRI